MADSFNNNSNHNQLILLLKPLVSVMQAVLVTDGLALHRWAVAARKADLN